MELKKKPLTVFSCCPTAPLKWSDVTSQSVVDCAKYHIPVEFISMPLTGFVAPVTLVGALVQHTAETISGIVISQLTQPACDHIPHNPKSLPIAKMNSGAVISPRVPDNVHQVIMRSRSSGHLGACG